MPKPARAKMNDRRETKSSIRNRTNTSGDFTCIQSCFTKCLLSPAKTLLAQGIVSNYACRQLTVRLLVPFFFKLWPANSCKIFTDGKATWLPTCGSPPMRRHQCQSAVVSIPQHAEHPMMNRYFR